MSECVPNGERQANNDFAKEEGYDSASKRKFELTPQKTEELHRLGRIFIEKAAGKDEKGVQYEGISGVGKSSAGSHLEREYEAGGMEGVQKWMEMMINRRGEHDGTLGKVDAEELAKAILKEGLSQIEEEKAAAKKLSLRNVLGRLSRKK